MSSVVWAITCLIQLMEMVRIRSRGEVRAWFW